ncbi:MAG: hypothetical protein WB284_00360, partial [Methanoregula sp.]
FLIQTKEIANKMIVCNIHRFLQFLRVKVFYRAEILFVESLKIAQNLFISRKYFRPMANFGMDLQSAVPLICTTLLRQMVARQG